MANGIEAKIYNALAWHMSQLVFSPAIPVAWPNTEFTPPASDKWIRMHDLPAPTIPLSVGRDGTNQYMGIVQLSLFWPMKAGLVQPKETAASVIAHFSRGTRIAHDGITVEITQAYSSAPIYEDRVMIPITVNHRTFVSNPA